MGMLTSVYRISFFPRAYSTLKLSTIFLVLLGLSNTAAAQVLNLASDEFTVSVAGTSFNSTVSVPSTGIIPHVSGVPTSGTLTIPTFTFGVSGTAITSTTGTFTAGIVIDEQSSMRRLEVLIPGIVLAFDGSDNLTGTLTTPTVKIYGRDASGATQAETSVASGGSVNFDDNSLSFDAAGQIALIEGEMGILGDIVTSLDNTGLSYDYTVILARTAGTNYDFQHSGGMSFTAASSEFVIGAGDNAVLDVTSQKLTGSLSFGGGGGGSQDPTCDAGETLVDGECVADTEIAQEGLDDADAAINDLDEGATSEEISGAIDDLTDVGDDIADLLADGDADSELGLNFSGSGTAAVDTLVGLSDADPDDVAENVGSVLQTVGTVFDNLDDLSNSEQDQVVDDTVNILTDVVGLVGDSDLSAASVEDLVESTETLLNGLITADDGAVATEVLTQITALVDAADTEIKIEPDATAQEAVQSFAYVLLQIAGQSTEEIIETVFDIGTVDSIQHSINFNLTGVIPDDLLNLRSDLSALNNTGTGSNTDFSFASHGTDNVTAHIVAVSIVPSNTAQGASYLPNGNIVLVSGNVSIELSPAAADVFSFIDGVEDIGATITLLEGGSMTLSDGTITAYATFGFEDVENSGDSNAGSATFFGPASGDESDVNYLFTVNYPNGGAQDLLPVIADDAFFDSVQGFGYDVLADRTTGVITIPGVGDFRPSYVVSNIEFSDAVYHQLNADASGVAYRVFDFNNDGILDVQVLTSTQSQLVLGMP
ncbi:MAG: hypothetical protein GKR91_00750 [Pseudomonadales bacterium]|nr:hypothetical protein [Pseudomonadales bacterium]